MPKSLYAAFDRFPSSKGAATHIEQTVAELFAQRPTGVLYCLGDNKLSDTDETKNGKIERFRDPIPNFLNRTRAYGNYLRHSVSSYSELEIVQFRDPWSGIPLLESVRNSPRFIYEVNGLPSIELPYHFPGLPPGLIEKISTLEKTCLESADVILTPSQTISRNLDALYPGLKEKTKVIPNGAVIPLPSPRPPEAPPQYLLYFGALQKWQGIGTLLRSFAEVSDLELHLVICSSNKPRFAKPWKKLCARLEIEDRVIWKSQLTRPRLQAWIQHAMMTVAPLTESSRNLEQGCCPLKILESMAAGTPVIASDLPVVREITDSFLVRPDRPENLAFAIRYLHDDEDLRADLGSRGIQRIQERYTWEKHREILRQIYAEL